MIQSEAMEATETKAKTQFERTFDMTLIRYVATDPTVWPYITDDFSPKPDCWKPIQNKSVSYLLAAHEGELLGIYALFRKSEICWSVHTMLLPGHGQKRGDQSARDLIEWVWQNTPCRRFVTEVPAFNRLALMFALRAGMKEYGRNPRSYMKNGELHDEILLGISKPEELCRS